MNPASDSPAARRDALCLLLVAAICSASYVFGLRHYSDDWFFLVPLATSADQSWAGLYRALAETPFAAVRPGQILWFVTFHKLAPGNATVVHFASHAVFAAAALVLHAALRRIPATRPAAYYLVLIYLCLPSFSAARMWYANHQASVSLLLFALTALLLTRMVDSRGRARGTWLAAAFAASAVGSLFYELFAITALLLPLFVWWGTGRKLRDLARDTGFLAATGMLMAALGATTLFKLQYSYGFELPDTIGEFDRFVRRAAGLYIGAAKTTLWTLGVYSPRAALGVLGGPYLLPESLLAPLLVLPVVAGREWLNRSAPARTRTAEARPAFFGLSGVIAFGLGYVPYLANFLYSADPWAESNRGNIAGALGAALLFYAAYRWAGERWPRAAAAVLLAFCLSGAFLQVAVGRMWVRAAEEQDRLLATFTAIASDSLREPGTVLLYRTCPYFGAGPIFPYGRDLEGRLVIERGIRHLEIDLVRPGMRVGAEGLSTQPGRWGSKLFRYGALSIVDMGDGSVHPIGDPAAARRFLAASPAESSFTCVFDPGNGTPLY